MRRIPCLATALFLFGAVPGCDSDVATYREKVGASGRTWKMLSTRTRTRAAGPQYIKFRFETEADMADLDALRRAAILFLHDIESQLDADGFDMLVIAPNADCRSPPLAASV